MYRALIAAAALLAFTGTASAETFACRSVSGEPPVNLDFALRYSSDGFTVISAAFQIEGDIGYSTTATEPTSLATIAHAPISAAEDVAFRFHYTDAEYDGDVASVRIVSLSEGMDIKAAGVIAVVGGGAWALECDLSYEG
jgi:hypothetical protein